jgi:uncharacterized protein (DUF2344 family)
VQGIGHKYVFNWTLRKEDEQRLTTAEMKFMATAGYSLLDRMRNEHILDKIKLTPVTEYVNSCRQNWLQHIKRTHRASIRKQNCPYVVYPLDDD